MVMNLIGKSQLLDHLNKAIDQTLLKPDTTDESFIDFFKVCNKHNFFAACFPSSQLELSKLHLKPSIKKVTVIGFPHGNTHELSKLKECEMALNLEADELDMVFAIGKFLSGDYRTVEHEIAQVANLVKNVSKNKILKVIIESSLLSSKQVEIATKLVGNTGADFIKTSTGFANGGATLEVVKIMKQFAPEHLKIKASGGIKNKEQAIAFIAAGASRLGTSSGVEICHASDLNTHTANLKSDY